jgi:hypothetical protein
METTPGPWVWIEDTLYGAPGSGGEYTPDNREPIVETDSGYYPPRGMDRTLIAAAPDLLAACKQALDFIHTLPYEPSAAPSTRAQDALVDAIAKAEGGAQ